MSAAVAVESTNVPLDVHSPPAASSSIDQAGKEVVRAAERRESYAAALQQALLHCKDMVVDFTSLKACLDPLAESAAENTDNVEVSVVGWG